MNKHELKTWPQYFQAIWDGSKPFEVRQNDRDYQVGDELHLYEWEPDTKEYTGGSVIRKVTYILDNPAFVKPGTIIMGIAPINQFWGEDGTAHEHGKSSIYETGSN